VTLLEVFVGVLVLVGIAGIVVPVLPGVLLVAGAIALWATEKATPTAWWLLAAALVVLAVGQVVKYLLPGRRLRATVPSRTLLVGALGAVVGFFVIPVVGVLVGFPVGVYLAERVRVGARDAGTSTRQALRAVGMSILIELASAVVATGLWITGLVLTAP